MSAINQECVSLATEAAAAEQTAGDAGVAYDSQEVDDGDDDEYDFELQYD